ncbi:hypothetical protein EXN66_Car015353 [Channa argus]|uniref:Uncharacterized protein n=1 Tax=Channa argus TaxID=215402 RepID=A0A6G1QBZ5_CHAAH|nr:hypothetical protein EXN66_Car015353 [Channa argus]
MFLFLSVVMSHPQRRIKRTDKLGGLEVRAEEASGKGKELKVAKKDRDRTTFQL